MDKRFNYFFSGYVNSTSADSSPQTIAKDVLAILPDKLCSFSVMHFKWSNTLVTGFIYKGKKYGYFTIRELEKAPVNISLLNGVYTVV